MLRPSLIPRLEAHLCTQAWSAGEGLSAGVPATIDWGVWLKILENPADVLQKRIRACLGRTLELRNNRPNY
jgi:hypothetical protein